MTGIAVPHVGTITVCSAEAVPAGTPRGEVWTPGELARLRAVAPTVEEARAVAELKLLVNGIVTGSRLGDRGPAPAPIELGMPAQAPTQRTKRFLDRGHGPRPVSAYAATVRR